MKFHSRYTAWVIWLIAGLFYLYEFVHRVSLAVMSEDLMRDFVINKSSLGALSAYYFWAYALMQIPVGILFDRFSSKLVLSIAAATVTVGSFIFAYSPSILIANISRFIIGFGSAFAFVGCIKIGSNWFVARKLAIIVGLTNLLGIIGAFIGGKPLAMCVSFFGWRSSMVLLALNGIIITILILLCVKDPLDKLKHTKPNINITQSIMQTLANRQIWLISGFASLLVAPIVAYAELWGTIFQEQAFNIPRVDAAQTVSFIFIGIGCGSPAWGYLYNIIHSRRLIMLIGTLGALISLTAIIYVNTTIYLSSLLHFLFGFCSSNMLLSFSLSINYSDNTNKATAISFINTAIMGLSAIIQFIIGVLLDYLSASTPGDNFKLAFLLLLLCQIFALCSIFFIEEPKNVAT